VHTVAVAAEYDPALHAVHGVAGLVSMSAWPDAQSVQDVVSAAEYLPTTQLMHGDDGRLSSSTVPAAHTVQAEEPRAA
jgi:hypothetical protein